MDTGFDNWKAEKEIVVGADSKLVENSQNTHTVGCSTGHVVDNLEQRSKMRSNFDLVENWWDVHIDRSFDIEVAENYWVAGFAF